MTSSQRSKEILALNDAFRRGGPLFSRTEFDGLWLLTSGVQARGPGFTQRALIGAVWFNDFTPDNDPYGEHDFGSFRLDGEKVLWKIDYLERGTQHGANDPSDNARTCRIITIMLASEY